MDLQIFINGETDGTPSKSSPPKGQIQLFQLLARDSSDPYFDETPGNDRVFVRVDNSAYSFGNDNDDSNSIFADAPDDEDVEDDVGQPSGPSGTTSLPENLRREILELGFPDDGYNYLSHLREIKNTGGGSAFYHNPKFKLEHLPRDVKAYDASRVQVNEVKNDDAHERSIYSVASKSVGVKVQRAVDPEILLRYGPLLVYPGVHQMQNEGSNWGHSCEQDLEKQGKSQEGLSVVGSDDEANQTLSTIVISTGETPEPNRTDNNDSKDELPPVMSGRRKIVAKLLVMPLWMLCWK
ncbi:hypothetical protein Dsin_003611 [Dipteronia sinensis]|uniref:Uncharacterized protein n=1 Tax=Dipteronia sinensis TaxID=43782 RepID=A0AAE0EMB4_9ROSI|nr:hypothetical protein Dsin_003611 [Dipteronia sinensis]